MSIVAYQGEVEFDGMFWDDQSGWRIRFRLCGVPGNFDKANPMKKFTKRRGDRVGTRFSSAFCPVSFGQVYNGEVMLMSWADSVTGWSATFEFRDEPKSFLGALRKTKDRSGTRYMLALAEIDHDENVIDQERRERIERAQSQGKRILLLSNTAAMLVKKPQFHEYLREAVQAGDWTEELADRWLKNSLGIDSKADLDDQRNTRAIQKFNKLRQDFEEWNNGPERTYS